ncbi:MAG: glycosyltransferase involved in cell wall biosynthesis [Desulforhopalus sp.]|jgi:glycosyltransferase involved in cell wall biosynthesis
MPKYYPSHSIFVGPSIVSKGGDTEGFGLTFVEAAMAGCLLIVTDVGGIRDVIQDGCNQGFTYQSKSTGYFPSFSAP